MMNTGKWSTRLLNIMIRIAAVITLVIAALPATPQSAASASSNPVAIPGRAADAAASTPQTSQIVPGWEHTCAITPEGGVVCWGANYAGQLGNGTTNQSEVPVAVSGLSSGVMSLALGGLQSCALTTLGRVYCWGVLSDGRHTLVPVEITGLGNQVIQLAVGNAHTCALTSSGKVLCWGYNYFGQLGNGTFDDSPTPVVAIAANAAQIATGLYTSCAVMTSGHVQCWGDGFYGQLGDGEVAPLGGEHKSNVPVQVLEVGGSPLTGSSQVGLGDVFGCALVGSGVHCWGRNLEGELGDGQASGVRGFASPVLTSFGGAALSGADQLGVGSMFACVHLSSGRLQCWGYNASGEIGNGSHANAPAPVTVLNPVGAAPLEGAVWVATGQSHACIFTNWEAVYPFYCWGNNGMGQIGIGTVTLSEPLPRPVADISGLGGGGGGGMGLEKQIVAGGTHTCALTTGEGLKCWGANSNGQLGDGTTTDRLNPVDVAGMGSDVKSLALGQNFTCALLPWGRLKCWGENTHGQLGDGSKIDSPLPVTILPGVTVRQVVAGTGHTCVLTLAGSVLCWGDNTYGQLGDGSTTESTSPVEAISSGAVGIALGGSTSCVVMSSSGLKCWGLGDYGQLGDGGSGAGHNQLLAADVQVSGGGSLAGATQVAVGANFVCALLAGGLVDCWGKNDAGQLGQGITSALLAYASPVVTEAGGDPLQGATQVTAGGAHACVRMYTDRLKCWGQGEAGQLGDGSSGSSAYSVIPHTVVDHYAPLGQPRPYLEATSQVSAGGAHTCAFIKWNGSNPYRCWGDNSRGQLGDGDGSSSAQMGVRSLANRIYPNLVQDPLNFGSPPLAKLASGFDFTCALTGAGGVKCWGNNTYGQLGDGTNTNSNTPVGVIGLSSGVTGLAASNTNACALTAAGGVKCWGRNDSGQLGNNTIVNSNTPVDVTGLGSGVIELAAGGRLGYGSHTCALISGGGVKCWGANDKGQLGNSTNTDSNTPVNVSGLSSGVIGLDAGGSQTCALTSGGGVKCWGFNYHGQLGNGTEIDSNIPVSVTGLSSGVIGLALGWLHSCALTSAGGVKCWGDSIGTAHTTPVDIAGLGSNVIELSAGGGHTCALTTGGGVKCWGSNSHGELGDGDTVYTSTPMNVVGLSSGVTSLSAGWSNTCAVLPGIAPLRCWGDNQYGQFGNGTTTSSLTPVDSKWLTAAGLVEDQKTEVILPVPHVAVVVPPQPIVTPVVVTVTQVPTPPTPPPDLVPVDVALQYDMSSDEKPQMYMYFHWDFTSLMPPSANALLSAAGFNEQSLNLYKYVNGTWIPMLPCTGCSLDTTNHVLIATLDGEGIYAMMAGAQTDYHIYLPLVTR
jgi:alpha-tubulin suppressor-like RCC1 family protein